MPRSNATNQRNGTARKRYLARRLDILRAAGKEFQTRGFAETGMRDIAQAAELSPANLYNYFRGKDEILFFCQDNSLDRMIAALEKARRMRVPVSEKLRSVIVSHVRCVLDEVEGAAAHLLTSSLPAAMQKRLVAKRDRYEEGVRQLISSGERSGEFVRCEPALAARAILGALNWSARWFRSDGPLTAGEIADQFAEYLIRGLLVKPNGTRLARSTRPSQVPRPYSALRKAAAHGEARRFSGER
ncbi:MAG TPA: TetR/AcrR family transcriptional regulator [Candidatus Acidoferrales bacterium]|nr:TetR/AcrR family transcriptional regulator [Candidatus Acidoferrales bacterium]